MNIIIMLEKDKEKDYYIYNIDLHGFNMAKSKMELDELFLYVAKYKEIKKINIIVGKGKGSEHGAILPAYVKNYLKEKSIDFKEEKEGIISVYLF